eukprot:2228369-Amphidinium_carterae.2
MSKSRVHGATIIASTPSWKAIHRGTPRRLTTNPPSRTSCCLSQQFDRACSLGALKQRARGNRGLL